MKLFVFDALTAFQWRYEHILPLDLISILVVFVIIPATTAAAAADDAVVNDIVENTFSMPMSLHTKCIACQLKYNDFDCILLILNES